jgi:pimeloyl-ACP methyl ester carboxylesterase
VVRLAPERWAHRNVHYHDESFKSREEARVYGQPLASRDGAQAFTKHLAETMAIGAIREFHARLSRRLRERRPFPVPLLLLFAERDPMVPARFADEFARLIPDAALVKLAEASHFAHVDAVDRFLPPVQEFLAAQP